MIGRFTQSTTGHEMKKIKTGCKVVLQVVDQFNREKPEWIF
jgi:hypothetical protein